MTKIAGFDLQKLPNCISRKIKLSENKNLGIFNTFKFGIFSNNQNSRHPK